MNQEIFPQYSHVLNTYRTYVRKKFNNKWYLCLVKTTDAGMPYFLRAVYLFILCGEVMPDLVDPNKNPIFILDEDQTDEIERLLPHFSTGLKTNTDITCI